MKLLSFSHQNKESWGAVADGGVIDLGKQFLTLADFIASPDFAQRDKLVAAHKPTLKLSDIEYLPVIPRPEKIICAVRNYLDHHKEAVAHGMDRQITEFPPIFLRIWRSQVGHNAPVVRPKVSTNFDWEGELAVVIGKAGRHIPESEAMSHVAGYSIYNDVSVRDYQRHAGADRRRQELCRYRTVRALADDQGRGAGSHQAEARNPRQWHDDAVIRHLASDFLH